MDTKQKTRQASTAQRSRSTAKKKKRTLLQRVLGTGKKQPASRTAQPKSRTAAQGSARTAAPKSSAEQRSRQEAQRRAAAQRQQAVQTAQPAQDNAAYTADQAIPEMVFKPEQQAASRVRTPEENKRSAMRRRSAKRTEERKAREKRIKNRPTVTYTQPAPFNFNKLLLQLTVVVAVVLAIVMGLSVFFKVETVKVYGNKAYSAWTIQEASGIEGGENLLTFGNTRACGKIITALPYVESVRIGINLPDTVNIYIEEFDVAYAIATEDGTWWLMTSTGKVVEQIDASIANSYTKVLGVELDSPAEGKQAVAVEGVVPLADEQSADEDAEASTEVTSPVVVVTGADRLKAALLILEALELNDIVGEAASIDVSNLNDIVLMYGQRYQVKLGDITRMEYKIGCMKQAVAQLNDYQTGILDASFVTWTDRVGYTPFA